jgi:hypothetical protein
MVQIRRARPAVAAVLLSAVATLTACGDDPATGAGTDESSTEPSTTPSSETTESPSEDASEQPPESLNVMPLARDAAKAGLPALVPSGLPGQWIVVDASFEKGIWTIGFQTAAGNRIDLWQADLPLDKLRTGHSDADQPGADVDLTKFQAGTWQTWSGATTNALGRELPETSVVLVGPDPEELRELPPYLLTIEADYGGEGD